MGDNWTVAGGLSSVLPCERCLPWTCLIRLSEVLDKGLRVGVEQLSVSERSYFLIADFIDRWETDGLSAYLYNVLPDVAVIEETVTAMKQHGLDDLAGLLGKVHELFQGYREPTRPTTWDVTLKTYDRAGIIPSVHKAIFSLQRDHGYGIPDSDVRDGA